MIVGLEAEPWTKVRAELEHTGLVRVEGSFLRIRCWIVAFRSAKVAQAL